MSFFRRAVPTVHAPRRATGRGSSTRGQSLTEFALVLFPLMLVLLGIMQMGLVLNAYVTMSNAAREGARAATVYVYDRNTTKSANDALRATAARDAVTRAMGILTTTSPQFASSDLALSYVVPSDSSDTDTRSGQQVTVATTYHLDLIIPLISNVLPRDGAGRLPIGAAVTMVIN